METVVISLGGSLIIPDKINYKLLEKFKKIVNSNRKKWKFAVVCGGGSIARKYIEGLEKENKTKNELAQAGIRATRMNSSFMMQFFGPGANNVLPKDMHDVKNQLEKNDIVFCGALRWVPNATSDTTAANLAHFLKAPFINLTNIQGMYSSNPKTHKNAKFISKITWKEFEKAAKKIPYKPGEHFVLDQNASTIIRKNKIPTYIMGNDLKNLDNWLNNKKWIGTTIND